MGFDFVSIDRDGPVAIVRFDRGNKANALSAALMRELTAAARTFEEDSETVAVILTGRADAFCMGLDLKDPELAAAREASLAERRATAELGRRMCRAWEAVEPLTIAAIEGWSIGGGTALAAACDLRVAAADARLSVPEIDRGLNMSWHTVPRLVNLMGPAKAKRFMILAEALDADRALDWGLVDEVAPPGGAVDAALALARKAAEKPPVVVRMIKEATNAYANALAGAASALDRDQFVLSWDSEDAKEGRDSFLEGRPPRYRGR